MKFKLVLSIFALNLISGSLCQSTRYLQITSYLPPNMETQTDRCIGTVISPIHVLTSASCAMPKPPLDVLVKVVTVTGDNETSTNYVVKEKKIHPEYNEVQSKENNIAILVIDGEFDTSLIPPKTLGALTSNSSCDVIIDMKSMRREGVNLYNSTYCGEAFPQLYCTTFSSRDNIACSANLGSPVICSNDGTIDGFVLTDKYCEITGSSVMLHYHSASDFREWIAEVSSAILTTQLSFLLILSVLLSNYYLFM